MAALKGATSTTRHSFMEIADGSCDCEVTAIDWSMAGVKTARLDDDAIEAAIRRESEPVWPGSQQWTS